MRWKDKNGIEHSDYYLSCIPCALCMDCKNFISLGYSIPFCKAFPTGIPEDVWNGTIMHTKPIEGDQGIQFEEKEYNFSEDEMQEFMDIFMEDI